MDIPNGINLSAFLGPYKKFAAGMETSFSCIVLAGDWFYFQLCSSAPMLGTDMDFSISHYNRVHKNPENGKSGTEHTENVCIGRG